MIFEMSWIIMKEIHHTMNQKNLRLNQKRQSTDASVEKILMLELFNNVFKVALIKILQQEIYEHIR